MKVKELGNLENEVEIVYSDVICISHAGGAGHKVDIILWINEEARIRLGLTTGLTVSPLGYIATLLELLADQANDQPKTKTNRFIAAIKADYQACKEWVKNVLSI